MSTPTVLKPEELKPAADLCARTLEQLDRILLGRAADLADHDDRLGLGAVAATATSASAATCRTLKLAFQGPLTGDYGNLGVNISQEMGTADGLSHAMHQHLVATLGEPYASRMVSAERLVSDFRSHRVAAEIVACSALMKSGSSKAPGLPSASTIAPQASSRAAASRRPASPSRA